jgi:hypothetical protein
MVCDLAFAMAWQQGLGNARRLQTRLGDAKGDTAGLGTTIGTHRDRNPGRYRGEAECKNNERNQDFEQRKTALAATPGANAGP